MNTPGGSKGIGDCILSYSIAIVSAFNSMHELAIAALMRGRNARRQLAFWPQSGEADRLKPELHTVSTWFTLQRVCLFTSDGLKPGRTVRSPFTL